MSWFNLRAQLRAANNELITLRRKLADCDAEEMKADFVFDFNTVNAFSVERNVHEGRPCTIIGYLLPTEEVKDGTITNSDKVREWCLYCSIDQHKALVKAFKESRK